MVVRATGINPAMLRWARERAGYSVEDVASRLRVSPERIAAWEAGRFCPTWRQLENLAYRLYHRSTTLFFLNDPPEEPTIYAEFSRLPAALLDDLQPDTLYAVRQARARQYYLHKIAGSLDYGNIRVMAALRDEAGAGTSNSLADLVRRHLGPSPIDRSTNDGNTPPIARWREWAESVGVWIFLRSFRQSDVSGFCLAEYRYPVIYLDYARPKQQVAATILRQFAHLIFDFNHMERERETHYLGSLTGDALAVEVACNDFVKQFISSHDPDDGTLATEDPRSGGGNFHATQAMRLGGKYLRAAFEAFEEERIDEATLSAALGVKGEAIAGLEKFAWHG